MHRRLFQPQQSLLSVPEAQVSPLRDTPNSSPAHHPKPSLPEEYTDPVAKKRPRISHLSSKAASDRLRLKAEGQGTRGSLDPRKLLDSLSEVCQQEAPGPTRLEPTRLEPPLPAQKQPPGAPPPVGIPGPNTHTISRKKKKLKEQVGQAHTLSRIKSISHNALVTGCCVWSRTKTHRETRGTAEKTPVQMRPTTKGHQMAQVRPGIMGNVVTETLYYETT